MPVVDRDDRRPECDSAPTRPSLALVESRWRLGLSESLAESLTDSHALVLLLLALPEEEPALKASGPGDTSC